MSKSLLGLLALSLAATPAAARPYDRGEAPRADWNSHWLDYKTDLSEAKRELRKDLRRANDPADRVDAYAEYRREVADARHDYDKEMAERGYRVRRGTVTIEE
jgi:hypothetical protein